MQQNLYGWFSRKLILPNNEICWVPNAMPKNRSINDIPGGKAYTIGMYAEWGAGKSSIISTAKSMLEDHDDKNIKVVVYDAWIEEGV